MWRQLRERLDLVRPRTLVRLQKTVDQIARGIRDLQDSAKEQRRVAKHVDEMRVQLQELTEKVDALAVRESQLRSVVKADIAFEEDMRLLPTIADRDRVCAHVRQAIAQARPVLDPVPHIVVPNVFPPDFYQALVRGIPPFELFADRSRNRRQLTVPFAYGPAFSRAIWTFLVDVVLEEAFQPAVIDRLREPLADFIAREWPALAADPLGPPMELHSTDGRILLRERGYRIAPHRDPKWGFITVLLYLPRGDESEQWGTQLYTVDQDVRAPSIAPYWIDPERCRLVADVPFRRNTALAFLNSYGAHGAHIPEDALPADMQRYMYQYRIGPTKAAIEKLVSLLPHQERSVWEGKMVDYLA